MYAKALDECITSQNGNFHFYFDVGNHIADCFKNKNELKTRSSNFDLDRMNDLTFAVNIVV